MNEEDEEIDQFLQVEEMLKKGISVHKVKPEFYFLSNTTDDEILQRIKRNSKWNQIFDMGTQLANMLTTMSQLANRKNQILIDQAQQVQQEGHERPGQILLSLFEYQQLRESDSALDLSNHQPELELVESNLAQLQADALTMARDLDIVLQQALMSLQSSILGGRRKSKRKRKSTRKGKSKRKH